VLLNYNNLKPLKNEIAPTYLQAEAKEVGNRQKRGIASHYKEFVTKLNKKSTKQNPKQNKQNNSVLKKDKKYNAIL
jgi:hypothetical protein